MTQAKLSSGDAVGYGGFTGGNDGTLVVEVGPAGSKVNAMSFAADGSVTFLGKGGLQSGTAQATTSGTSIDFTDIPSWVKRITVMLNGVSTNGTSPLMFQLGDSGGVETTGYVSSGAFHGTATGGATSTAGLLNQAGGAVADTTCGTTTLVKFDGNTWVSSSVSATGTSNYTYTGGGSKTLSATLDRIRLTTVGGTDTFDAGSVNILCEG